MENTKTRLVATVGEKDDLNIKVSQMENKIVSLQLELNKKDRENYNIVLAENTEKHLTNLCQTLTAQLEDLRMQLKLADEKCKRTEAELSSKNEKSDSLM